MIIDDALKYLKYGFSVIPIKYDGYKKPYILWGSFQSRLPTPEEIKTWWAKWPDARVGIITGKLSGICVIDIDDPNQSNIWGMIPDPVTIPTSKTPRGLHLYFKYPSEPLGNNARMVPGCDFRGEGGYVVAYEWLPGQSIFEIEPPELPQAYMDFIQSHNLPRQTIQVESGATIIPEGQRDERLFHLANRLFRGGANVEEVREHLIIFANACVPPFPAKELEEKVKSALKRDTIRSGSLSQDVTDWVSVTEGYWSVTDLDRELQLVTKVEKNNRKQIIHRLVKDKVLERFPNKNGTFRRVITEYNEIDMSIADDTVMSVKYPFEIEKLVDTMPKNIIICAGEPDSGKTSFLLNFTHMNMAHHTIRYLTSEMSRPELRSRLSKFDTKPKDWRVQFIERAANFADLILPDAITLIDYLEISDNFFLVAGMIKEIFDRLNRGIAMIALQKNRGTDLGLGGGRSLEKARLYLAMSFGRIKIVKGKNWASDTNPNGLVHGFKLVQGAHFIRMGEWHRED